MKILIAPAKKMIVPEDGYFQETAPAFAAEAAELRSLLYQMSFDELKTMYKCSDKTLQPVYDLLKRQEQGIQLSGPALLSYQGLAFRNMAPDVFDDEQWQYVQDHLIILSGMYGMLKPLDSIMPYRLEMQNKPGFSLYSFWGDKIARKIQEENRIQTESQEAAETRAEETAGKTDRDTAQKTAGAAAEIPAGETAGITASGAAEAVEDDSIINLASKEYSKAVSPWLPVVDIRFFEEAADGRRTEPGAYAKMARGRMVRWMAENHILRKSDLKSFNELGYSFDPDAGDEFCMVFVRPASKS